MEFILKYLPILITLLATIFGTVVWFVRLEDKVKANHNSFLACQVDKKDDEVKRDREIEKIFNLLTDMKGSVDQIRGFLSKGGNL